MNNPYLSFKGLFRNHFSGTLPLLAIVLTVVFGLGIASQSYGQGVPGVQNGADFQTQFDELVKEYDPLLEQWTADYRGAKTRAERSEVLKRKPSGTYGDKLLELYETHADEPGSKAALEKAITLGAMQIKTKAATLLFELAPNQPTDDAEQTYLLIAQRGWGEIKTKAIQALLDRAKVATDDEVANRHLEHVLTTKGRAEKSIAEEASQFFWNKIEGDLKSETAAATLILLGQHSEGEFRDKAFEALLDHHPDSDKLFLFVNNVPQEPSPISERVLEFLCKSEDVTKRMQAAVSLSKYYRNREKYKGFYGNGPDKEEEIEKLGQQLYDYLQLPADPSELEALKQVLKTDFEGDEELVAQVKEELFIVENFSIGSQAIEIEGKDLDGESFRLSDYKGKVVFLDFWGDW